MSSVPSRAEAMAEALGLGEVTSEIEQLRTQLSAVSAAVENLPLILHAVESDLTRTPEGDGGELHFIPATPKHGTCGCPGDNVVRWINEIRAALAGGGKR